ncbi:MAG: hypothetical protein ACREPT_13110 [Rudaea sp.]
MTTFLQGSYSLDPATVDRVVTQRSAGTYVLGHKSTGRMFTIALVGRAENDLNVRLKQLSVAQSYGAFMFQYCESAQAAFVAECGVFHTFAPPDNKSHPTRPASADWKCPSCQIFG